jgi:hypothetical protein
LHFELAFISNLNRLLILSFISHQERVLIQRHVFVVGFAAVSAGAVLERIAQTPPKEHTYPTTKKSETSTGHTGPADHFGSRIQQESNAHCSSSGADSSRDQHDRAFGSDLVSKQASQDKVAGEEEHRDR